MCLFSTFYLIVDRELYVAALLEFGKRQGHCNVPLTEPFECDMTVRTNEGTEEQVHFNGHLGTYSHINIRTLYIHSILTAFYHDDFVYQRPVAA